MRACVFVCHCMCILNKTDGGALVENRLLAQSQRQGPGRAVINMLVSMHHSIIPCCPCFTAALCFHRTVLSAHHVWAHTQMTWLSPVWAAPQQEPLFAKKVTVFLYCVAQQQCRYSCWIWYSFRFQAVAREGIQLILSFLPLLNDIARPPRWAKGKCMSPCHFKMKTDQWLTFVRLKTMRGFQPVRKNDTHFFFLFINFPHLSPMAKVLNCCLVCMTVERSCC